jgi:hypothetical protein
MQLWPATIASPSREACPHGGYNYSVFPQQNTTVCCEGKAQVDSRLVRRESACAFFMSDDLPESTSCLGVPLACPLLRVLVGEVGIIAD